MHQVNYIVDTWGGPDIPSEAFIRQLRTFRNKFLYNDLLKMAWTKPMNVIWSSFHCADGWSQISKKVRIKWQPAACALLKIFLYMVMEETFCKNTENCLLSITTESMIIGMPLNIRIHEPISVGSTKTRNQPESSSWDGTKGHTISKDWSI